MKAFLEEHGMEVVGTVLPDECCHKLLMKRELKALKDSGAEAIVGMSCGDGVQTVADNVQLPVYPANNTMFLGQVERVGMFNEYCHMCGDCVLGSTGGVCPITKCAKSLVNGPCGGQKNGKCEVNPDNVDRQLDVVRHGLNAVAAAHAHDGLGPGVPQGLQVPLHQQLVAALVRGQSAECFSLLGVV